MDFGRGMRSKHYPVLFGELCDAQRLGEAGAARGIKLNVTYAALHDEIAHGKTRQFALAMRQRDRGRRRQSGEIGRLQIPMQRLFEPEDPIRFDGTGEFDAVGQIVGAAPKSCALRPRRSCSSKCLLSSRPVRRYVIISLGRKL